MDIFWTLTINLIDGETRHNYGIIMLKNCQLLWILFQVFGLQVKTSSMHEHIQELGDKAERFEVCTMETFSVRYDYADLKISLDQAISIEQS